MKNFHIYLLLTFFAFQWVTAQTVDLREYTTRDELMEEEAELIAGWVSFPGPREEKSIVGKKELEVNYLTSNFEADFFRNKKQQIQLCNKVTQEFATWGYENNPGTLILKRVSEKKGGQFEVVGWVKVRGTFPVTEALFPEHKALNLIDFDTPEGKAYLDDHKVVAGELFQPFGMAANELSETDVTLNYPTSNFEEHDRLYMTMLELVEPLSDLTLDWIKVNEYKTLLFQLEDNGKYALVGYSQVPFFFR